MSLKFAGKFSQAKAAYERALELNPKHAPTHFALSDLGQINDSERSILETEMGSTPRNPKPNQRSNKDERTIVT